MRAGAHGITRRDLLKIGALGAVGGALTISGLAKNAADAAQAEAALGAVPRGAPLADFDELVLTTVAGTREGSLAVAETDVRLGGSTARMLAYNGQVPGPLVRVRSGETLRLHVRNGLTGGGVNPLGEQRGATNLHTHGWHVSPADPADNVMRRLDPGESWTYTYDLGRQPAGPWGGITRTCTASSPSSSGAVLPGRWWSRTQRTR